MVVEGGRMFNRAFEFVGLGLKVGLTLNSSALINDDRYFCEIK